MSAKKRGVTVLGAGVTKFGELWEDSFRALIGQALINQRNNTSAVPQLQSTNETEYYNYSLSPYLRNHLGSFADTELRYTFAQNEFKNSGNGTIPSSLTNQITGVMNSGTEAPKLSPSFCAHSARSSIFLRPRFSRSAT